MVEYNKVSIKLSDSQLNQIPLYAQDIKITYFESFGIEHVPKEI